MSKNKNPLKDLDLFLKQQAASFVNPTPLSEKIEETTVSSPQPISEKHSGEESILQTLERLMEQNPAALYDLLIQVAEKKSTAERTMLINTALYLKNTQNQSGGQTGWQEAIRTYWKNRN